jgi:hypothetical protein
MTKFKVGDRVAVYHHARMPAGIIIKADDYGLCVQFPHGDSWYYHPKQCRKLVRKKADAPPKQGESFEDMIIHNASNICEGHFEYLKKKINHNKRNIERLYEAVKKAGIIK